MRFVLFIVFFYVIGPGHSFVSDVSANEEALPSQQSRFDGMGAIFKAKKKEAQEAAKRAEIEKAEQEAEEALNNDSTDEDVTYFKLHTFVVNVIDQRNEDKLLFLTLDIFCKISNPDDKWLVDNNIAPIKDTIITYTSGLNRQEIQTQKQKKELQKELTLRVTDILKKLTGKRVISDLYLTRIIVQ